PDAQRRYLSDAVAGSRCNPGDPTPRYLAWVITTGPGGGEMGPITEAEWTAPPDEDTGIWGDGPEPQYRPPPADGRKPRAYLAQGLVVAFSPKVAKAVRAARTVADAAAGAERALEALREASAATTAVKAEDGTAETAEGLEALAAAAAEEVAAAERR